jgi:cation-transporting P-type ATPase E
MDQRKLGAGRLGERDDGAVTVGAAGAGGTAAAPAGALAEAGQGLDQAQVRARVAAGQVNAAPLAPGRSLAQILRANVFTRFNAILGALLVVVLIVGPFQDALFGVVLVVNTAIGVFQELRAKRTLDRLAILTAPTARVVRDGTTAPLPAEDVVLDDVLDLQPGDQVTVDALVLRSEGLELDEALLSGEAEPVVKAPGDRVLSGSFVAAGTGRARAAGIGASAYAARLQAQARRFSLVRSELQQGTNTILRAVTWVMVPAGILLIISQLFRSDETLPDALRGSVGGVSAMVPEGLVLLTSIAFAVGAMRLARRRVLVQELAAIEGLARVSVLCIDKTGTLTTPGMHLAEVVPADGQRPAGLEMPEIEQAIGAVAAADPAPNATMQALAGRYPAVAGWTATARVPFSSARKWSAVSFEGRGTWVLGAPGIIGAALPAGEAAGIQAAAARREGAGQRVLLLCRAPGPGGAAGPGDAGPGDAGSPNGRGLAGDGAAARHVSLPTGLVPVALLVLTERLRGDAQETVSYLLSQDITVVVLSGDAPQTVAAIASRAGVPLRGAARDAASLPDGEAPLAEALAATSVFGRVRPEQKLTAVRALQSQGHVVAMLGDGVNDVQALKQADLGIAMGSGSQASRSVGRIVLLDNSFAVIPYVLAEGRRVIANIERVSNLFVTKTTYAAVLAVVVGVAGVAFPFFPRHLTLIATLTIGVPGFFLALAPGAPRARPGFVRRVAEFTIPAGLAAAIATYASYAIARAAAGTTDTESRTAAMLALFCMGLWVLGLIARPLSLPRILLLAAMAACLVLALAIPLGRRIFSLELPPAPVLLAVAAVTAASIAALTLWRHFSRGTDLTGPHWPGRHR